MKLRNILCLAAVLLCTAGCSSRSTAGGNPVMELTVGGHVFTVEIADTPDTRKQGFMERKHIGADQGMLFVFPEDRRLSFWMENTPSPLSIAYIDSRGVIREIFDMEPLSRKAVQSTFSVRYALEVPRGRFAELGIGPGDRVGFPGGKFPAAGE